MGSWRPIARYSFPFASLIAFSAMALPVCRQTRANTIYSLWANISRTLMFVEYRPLRQPSIRPHSARRLQPSLDTHLDDITLSCPLRPSSLLSYLGAIIPVARDSGKCVDWRRRAGGREAQCMVGGLAGTVDGGPTLKMHSPATMGSRAYTSGSVSVVTEAHSRRCTLPQPALLRTRSQSRTCLFLDGQRRGLRQVRSREIR